MNNLATALRGVRVLDFSRYAPGLFGTRILADMGAEVISVEPPGADADSFLYRSGTARREGRHPFFAGRRSLVLDLRTEEGRSIVARLLAAADVVVEGFRPGVADRIGIGFEAAQKASPRVVYCSVTGYGQSGEGTDRPGHDINYLAEAGVLSLTSDHDEEPGVPLNLIADISGGGMVTAIAILGALHAARGGAGAQRLDVSMVSSIRAMLAPVIAMRDAGTPDPSWRHGMLNGAAPYYGCYRTSDGEWVAVGAIEPPFYAALCRGVDLPEFSQSQNDMATWPALRAALAERFSTRTRDEWCHLLRDAAVTPVLSLTDAWAAAGEPPPVGIALLPGLAPAVDRYATDRGGDTTEVLAELGLDDLRA